MADVISLRLPADLLEWSTEYAKTRGVSRTDLLIEGLRSFKEDCDSGVPEIRAARERQAYVQATTQGVGVCPKRAPGLGHVWKSHRVDPYRSCEFCGMHGREPATGMGKGGPEGGGYFAEATAERAEVFSRLKAEMVSGSGKPEKVAK